MFREPHADDDDHKDDDDDENAEAGDGTAQGRFQNETMTALIVAMAAIKGRLWLRSRIAHGCDQGSLMT